MHREMKRGDKEVKSREWMEDVLKHGQIIYIALSTMDGEPYVLPLGYGYEDGVIYLHGGNRGQKKDMAAQNPKVSFNVSIDTEVMRSSVGANFSMKYKSVTGFGRIVELTTLDEKNKALEILMKQYDGPHTDLTESNMNSVWVVKIDIDHMTGKISGYPKPE